MTARNDRFITRRAVTAGAALFASPGFAAMPSRDRDAEVAAAQTAILAGLNDRDAASVVGRMTNRPDLRDRHGLVNRILDDLQMEIAEAPRAGTGEIRKRLARRIQGDFAAGRTVILDGWLLTQTEVRLCALAALQA